jgi:putative oxidoreductase
MPSQHLRDGLVPLVLRLAVGGIFLVAAVSKIAAPGDFVESVRAYHLLPASLVVPFALVLPWIELLAAAYLLLGFMTRVGAIAAGAMLAMFIVALADALLTGNTAHACGCFGGLATNPLVSIVAGGSTIGWWDVIRDVILLGFSAWLAWRGGGLYSIEALFQRGRERAGSTGAAWERP